MQLNIFAGVPRADDLQHQPLSSAVDGPSTAVILCIQPTSRPQLLSHVESLCAALVEALMGFQFNHVGGGTKTRRPITLHMKYNSSCVQPNCYLVTDDAGEQEVSLEELQVPAHLI